MKSPDSKLRWQTAVLVFLRFLIGWHFLYEGLYKLIHPEWSSLAFLAQAQGFLSGFYRTGRRRAFGRELPAGQ